jgi:thiamine pyrophosphate-dependent acetolactate synthase large subunit-like protein
MIERERAFAALAAKIEEQIVVTAIANQTASWYQAKDRPLNLYLRGPMGLAVSVGLGVALAHPDRQVVVIEGDGGLLMGLTSLAAVAHCQPANFKLVCMDNGHYEAGGKGPTVNAGRTNFVQIVQGLGIRQAAGVYQEAELESAYSSWLGARECAFLHVAIGPRPGPVNAPKLKPYEMKYRFFTAIKSNRRPDEAA